MPKVVASREGLKGRVTAPSLRLRLDGVKSAGPHGVVIDSDDIPFTLDDLFVALPSRGALGRWVRILYRERSLTVPVLDLGPFFPYRKYPSDDAYVFGSERPLAEKMRGQVRDGDTKKLNINGAGIDLSDGVILALGVSPEKWGLREVTWEFLDPALEHARGPG